MPEQQKKPEPARSSSPAPAAQPSSETAAVVALSGEPAAPGTTETYEEAVEAGWWGTTGGGLDPRMEQPKAS